jgi:hypothetical protein
MVFGIANVPPPLARTRRSPEMLRQKTIQRPSGLKSGVASSNARGFALVSLRNLLPSWRTFQMPGLPALPGAPEKAIQRPFGE